jgi:predicted ribosomally synthesized peptide with SipW-like signal peptide
MSRKRIKQYLMLLLAVGVIAVVANGSGTFASFNAETQNNNNTFATGTLLLHNTANGGTTCASESNSGNINVTDPTGCQTLFAAPGSIGSPATGTLNTAITGSPVTTLNVNITGNYDIQPGDQIKVSEGANNDTFTATKLVTPGANVNIPVISQATANTYTTSATVAVQTFTQFATLALKNAGTLDAQDIKFSFPSGCTNSASQTLTLGTASVSNGSPSTITLTSGSAYGAPVGGVLKIGTDTLTVITSQVNPGNTVINVSGTVSGGPYVTQPVTFQPFINGGPGSLCSGLHFNIVETNSSFNHDSTNPALLCSYGTTPAVAAGIGCKFSNSDTVGTPNTLTALSITDAVNSNLANELDANQTRYFVIGVTTNVAGLTNADQNQTATFAMRWHIDPK